MSRRIPVELRALRDLFHRCDPTPDHMVHAAYAAAARVREWGGGVALELVGDSAEAPVPTRAGAQRSESRVLTFLMPGRVLEIDLVPTVDGMFRASGMVISRAGQGIPEGEVVLRYPDGQQSGQLDKHGGFTVHDVPSGPLSMVFRPASAPAAVADWLVC